MSGEYDLVFISETNLGYDALPRFDKYVLIANPDEVTCSHGGIAWYVKDNLAAHVYRTRFHTSYISLQLDIVPNCMFMGVYFQPEGTRYFEPSMFSDVVSALIECTESGVVPYIGGDFNSHIGDPNIINTSGQWRYNQNKDVISKKHGRTYFRDLCNTTGVMPINCLKYDRKNIDNDFTFYGGNGNSQIDYALTHIEGRRTIKHFEVISKDWHVSDHRPILSEIYVHAVVNLPFLLSRARDLNFEHNEYTTAIRQFRGNYDYEIIKNVMISGKAEIEENLNRHIVVNDVQSAVNLLEHHLQIAHKSGKLKATREIHDTVN